MTDLFGCSDKFEEIQMPGADVSYLPQVDLGESYEVLLQKLIDQTPWRSEKVFVWGKEHVQPRLVAWYGDEGKIYNYSRIRLEPLPWTESLFAVKNKVEVLAGTDFNSVLLNYYRDNKDSMGFHSDDEPELGYRPIIASLSLGEERALLFKHKSRLELKSIRVSLGSGSLLLMKGETQTFWKHGINKQSRPCGPRVNLTFRRIVS
jgi:alkylated DNA repair dioxygenase AlkB